MKPIADKRGTYSPAGYGREPWYMLRLCACCLVCVLYLCCTNAWSDVYHVDSVRVLAPKINNDSLVYTLDIHFLERPGPFWSYYDPETGSLIVEFLDAQVFAPEVKFSRGLPFRGFKVRNMNSEMALTKLISRFLVSVDRGGKEDLFWNSDVRLVGESTVRIIIWKEKAVPEKTGVKKARAIAISVGLSALVVFAVIALLTL